MAQEKDTPMPSSTDRSHVIRTSQQWESAIDKYSVIPWGVLCIELTPDGKTKAKVGEGNKFYSQLPYISDEIDLSKYYTKDEVDLIIENLEFMSIKETVPYDSRNILPRTGNKLGDVRFVKNLANPGDDPLMYIWNGTKWVFSGGSIIDTDLSEYAKKSEVYPRLQQLEALSHAHRNKDILDETSAVYTVEKDEKLASLKNYDVFVPATVTTDGEEGLVPAPLAGDQAKFLRGDGIWAKVKTGDKYRAGDGITILSGEVISDTFPFQVLPQAEQVTQYIIYGAPGGVGESVTGGYRIQINASAEGHTDRSATVIIPDKLYEGDYVDYQKQVYSTYRTNVTSRVSADPNYSYGWGIYSDGRIAKKDPGAYSGYPRVTALFELEPGASYEITAYNDHDDWKFENGMHINLYDADQNVTRTIAQSSTGNTTFTPAPTDKYMRFAYREDIWSWTAYGRQTVYQLKDIERPCGLPELFLYPGIVNTIDATTTVKPSLMYIEIEPPDDPESEDPMSEFTGMIYNDGVLDVTQEDPNALNEITVHFRENVEKTLTIPTYELPIASDTTLGGIKVGNNLTIDPVTGELSATGGSGGTEYSAGQGIEIEPVSELIDQHFNYTDYINTVQGVEHGSIMKNNNDSFTITSTANDAYTYPYNPGHGTLYTMTVEPNTKYRLTMDLSDWTVDSYVNVFKNQTTYNWRADMPGNPYLEFTTESNTTVIAFRFGVTYNGHTQTFSNIKLYQVSESMTSDSISAKLGTGLSFDNNDAIELEAATDSTLGGVIVSDGLSVANDGTLSVNIGDGLSFDSNDAIEVDSMIGATSQAAGTGGTVPAPLAGDDVKFLRGDGTWAEVDAAISYVAGDAIEFTHPGMIDLGFDFDTFVSKFTTPSNGTVSVDSANKTFTLTSTGPDAYTTPWAGGDLYTIPVVGGRKYRLTWNSNAPNVGGNVYAFENANTSHMHGVNQADQNYLEFTADTTSNVNFRFGIMNSGNTITFSNIKFYEVDNVDPDTNIINVKYGSGLSLDVGNRLQANAMTGADGTNAGTAGIVPAPSATDNTKFLKGDGTWSDTPTYTLPIASAQTLGGIKVGNNLTIDANGVLSATGGSGGGSYTAGDGIDIEPTLLSKGFSYTDFINSVSGNGRGTLTKNNDDSFTMTATDDDFFTNPFNLDQGISGVYIFSPVEGEKTYRLTWDSSDRTVSGRVFVFENGRSQPLHYVDQSVDEYLEFTTASGTTSLSFRFGVENTGDTLTYSNIELYEVVSGSSIISAKLGTGLSFDNNGAIQTDVMTGADGTNAGTSGTVPAPTATDNAKFLKGDGTWDSPPSYTLPVATTTTLGGVKVGAGLSMNANDELGVTTPYVTSVTNQGSTAGVITISKSDGTSSDVDVLDNIRLILNCNFSASETQNSLGVPVNAPQSGRDVGSPIMGDLTVIEVNE